MSASKIAIGCMHVLAKLPLPVLRGLGKFVGRVLFVVAGQRRRIALRNFELCFPDVPEAQRKAWAKESLRSFARLSRQKLAVVRLRGAGAQPCQAGRGHA
jgi:KDO2-lipid IV(A) lauroyltransferase